jgi:acyl-coenzyme A synthetase/AMP-(fatty) acid ligase
MSELVYRKWLATAKRQASRIAIMEPGGQILTFCELQQQVAQFLQTLTNKASWRRQTIAFQMENSAEWLVAFLVCQALDAIALPFDPDIPRDGIDKALETIRPAAFWNKQGIEPLKHSAKRAPACLIKLTSGTTGLPKPLFFEDRQMLADGKQITDTMRIHKGDTNLALVPFGHSYGLGNLVIPLIQTGVSLAVCRDPFPHSISRIIKETGATVVPAVPPILRALSYSEINPKDLESVRLWISAGSTLDSNDARNFFEKFGTPIHNFYGSSETGGIAFDRSGRDTLSGRSVGTPLKGVRISLSPSNRLQVCSEAVFTRGNPLKAGHLACHLMNDEAALIDSCSIVIQGRRGRIAKIAGKRVNLSEIERHLINMEGIREIRVTEYVNKSGRTRLAAAIAPIQDYAPLEKALKAHLPKWKIPDRWLTLKSFPLTRRGKINYSKIECQLRS